MVDINPAMISTRLSFDELKPLLANLEWSRVGRHGCDVNYDEAIHGSSTYAIRETMQRAATSGPVLTEQLLMPDGSRHDFSILCVNYATGWYMSKQSGPRYVIAPQDAGWVVRAVAPFMRPGMRPVFARGSRAISMKGKWINAPAWANWIQTRWICPNCIPQMNNDYQGRQREWDNNECSPQCDVSGDPSGVWTGRFGYDIRVMMPWVRDLRSESGNKVCNPLVDQPGTDAKEPPVCLPIPIFDLRECRTPVGAATYSKYWEDFWSEVGKAITLYNASSRAAAREAEVEQVPPPRVPPPPPPPPAPAVARSRSLGEPSSKLPLVIGGAAALAVAALLWRRRSS